MYQMQTIDAASYPPLAGLSTQRYPRKAAVQSLAIEKLVRQPQPATFQQFILSGLRIEQSSRMARHSRSARET